jgi:hypothetical protein
MILILIFFKKISQLNAVIMTLNDIMRKKKSLFWSYED